jgi:hypothetical protein
VKPNYLLLFKTLRTAFVRRLVEIVGGWGVNRLGVAKKMSLCSGDDEKSGFYFDFEKPGNFPAVKEK